MKTLLNEQYIHNSYIWDEGIRLESENCPECELTRKRSRYNQCEYHSENKINVNLEKYENACEKALEVYYNV